MENASIEYLKTEHGIFTNNLLTSKTAQECYDDFLKNKDNDYKDINIENRLQALEDALIFLTIGGVINV